MDATKRANGSLPVVECVGSARDRGRAHGEHLRATIRTGLERWMAALGTTHGVDPDRYLAEFLENTGYLATISDRTPALLDEVRGIAEGADKPFERVVAFNLLDEEWAYGKGRGSSPPGCTVVCVPRASTSDPVMAQTMDIPSVHDGAQAVLRLRSEAGPDVLAFTYAGMIGLNGCNDAGVGIVVNNLQVLPSSPHGLPVAFVVRGVLECPALASASAFIRGVPHATGQHYAVGDPGGFASFECSAEGVVQVPTVGDRVLHTNHPLVSADLDTDSEGEFVRSRTRERYAYIHEQACALGSRDAVERALTDTSVPVSLAYGSGVMTFGAISIELSVPPRLRVAPGPPHRTPFVDVGFSPDNNRSPEEPSILGAAG